MFSSASCPRSASPTRSRLLSNRRAVSLVEVILSMVLMTMVMLPLISMLTLSDRVWKQFHSPHQNTLNRQLVMESLASHVRDGVRLSGLTTASIAYVTPAGTTERIYQNRDRIVWEHDGVTDSLYSGTSRLSIVRVSSGSSPTVGEVIELILSAPTDATQSTRVINSTERKRVRIHDSI